MAETNRRVKRVDTQTLLFESGEPVDFDLLIISPTYRALPIWKPLPSDAQGFLRTVPETRQVQGWDDIYAIGDGADYPVKQGFLALLQADAAAEHLAARLLGTEPAFSFEPASLWVMEEFGQALVAHVPLDTSEETDAPADSTEADIKLIPPGLLQRMACPAMSTSALGSARGRWSTRGRPWDRVPRSGAAFIFRAV
jgi:hypothetical protein